MKIEELLQTFFDKNDEKPIAASEQQIAVFVEKCRRMDIPSAAWGQLADLYRVTNGVRCLDGFDFHACDDEIIFEWRDEQELWLGQCNDDVLRWADGRFCLGDASNISYGKEYEFPLLTELLEFAFSEWEIA